MFKTNHNKAKIWYLKCFDTIKKHINIIYNDIMSNIEKLKTLKTTNIELGKFHLNNGNINDALFRFNLIRYVWRDVSEINKYLGITFFLKKNYDKAQYYLKNFSKELIDDYELKYYYDILFAPQVITNIPAIIRYRKNKISKSEYLIKIIREERHILNNVLKSIFNKYLLRKLPFNVLEYSPEQGEIGVILKNFFPSIEIFAITELSENKFFCDKLVVNQTKVYKRIYDKSLNEDIAFINIKFDLIICLFQLNNSIDLVDINHKFELLNQQGLAIFGFLNFDVVKFDSENECFGYTEAFIKAKLLNLGFGIEEIINIQLNKEKFLLFICKKN